jgi:hypothetical protein
MFKRPPPGALLLAGTAALALDIGVLFFSLRPSRDFPVLTAFLLFFWISCLVGIKLITCRKDRLAAEIGMVAVAGIITTIAILGNGAPDGINPLAFGIFLTWSMAAAFAMIYAYLASGTESKPAQRGAQDR